MRGEGVRGCGVSAERNARLVSLFQSYPDEAHALSGVKRHVYHTMDDFWTRAFHLPPPEWANQVPT